MITAVYLQKIASRTLARHQQATAANGAGRMTERRAIPRLMIFLGAAALGTAAFGAAAPDATDRYFRMKQVTIIDAGMNQLPAVDLMIPTTWQFQGEVRWGGSIGGCFADGAAIIMHAQSADGSVVFEGMPSFTWQFADDPATQRGMVEENQGGLAVGLKPCPVIQPMRAEDFLRQALLPKVRPDKRVVAVEPMPQFEQLIRQRLRLPQQVHTEAARARLEYELEGQAVEEWLTTVVIVNTYPTGRGNIYDCHAVMLLALRAPKGKLDGNDRLFKLIASTIRREPQWDARTNALIAQLYQKKQLEEAKRSAIIAAMQQHIAQTINESVANQQRSAAVSAAGADQVIRGVQSFRNPATGATFELSNQYDHAWLNGSNEYVMSDDPNFNPNGRLSGSWTSLKPAPPQP
jgi:hypothetical protein